MGSAHAASATSARLTHVNDLKDKRIAVLLGSAHVDYVTKTWPKATLLQFGAPSDLLLAIKTGKADAGLSDAEPLREMMREDNMLGVLGGNLFSFPEGVGFRKENTKLLEEFNRFLSQLKRDGVHADMLKRWIETNVTAMPVIPEKNSNGALIRGWATEPCPPHRPPLLGPLLSPLPRANSISTTSRTLCRISMRPVLHWNKPDSH